ncbi:hypothetical protein [Tessaracoccus defluvii]|uniref:Ig-like domain-containing protein n=1 Tax=Tessaracoccus defluvii TaxID=1285901 RepID=A0A7H0H4I3_9ACTN|nr:hypothetical protein [Tessaracoccus defluvii]QNP55449.1 hypothetical protein H9L22_14795 [Tessaracoccus defluvii]
MITPGTYFHLYENDVLVHVQALDARLGSPQIIEVPVTDKAAGTYKYRGDLVNSHGTRKTSVTVARVS